MGKDYYKVLGVSKCASPCAIRKAYHTMALRYHPDKNKDPGAEENFKEISEAYDVLSDPEKRKIFDSCGEEGLKRGGICGKGSCGPGYMFSGNPVDMFESLFGSTDRFYEYLSGCQYGDGFPSSFKGQCRSKRERDCGSRLTDGPLLFSTSGPGLFSGNCPLFENFTSACPLKDAPINTDICVGLYDLYTGCTKKMKIKSRDLAADGHVLKIREQIIEICVKPGWKEGTKITFPELGDTKPGRKPVHAHCALKTFGVVLMNPPHGPDFWRMRTAHLRHSTLGLVSSTRALPNSKSAFRLAVLRPPNSRTTCMLWLTSLRENAARWTNTRTLAHQADNGDEIRHNRTATRNGDEFRHNRTATRRRYGAPSLLIQTRTLPNSQSALRRAVIRPPNRGTTHLLQLTMLRQRICSKKGQDEQHKSTGPTDPSSRQW